MNRKLFLAILFSGVLFVANAQQKKKQTPAVFGKQIDPEIIQNSEGKIKCASFEYEMYQRETNQNLGSIQEFENWLAPKIQEYKQRQAQLENQPNLSVNNVITIPVVVHVIHNPGLSVGTSHNISNAQILSQITVLNNDYRKIVGTPGHNTHPAGADVEIEFCLAQRTPQNLPTNGINRVAMAAPGGMWTMENIDGTLKPATVWNPNDYLNIWVVNSIYGGFVAGYAQFPIQSGVPGLDNVGTPTTANTDGVVIDHTCFGTTGTAEFPYNGGRTTTHEIGHYLGLRHIWGDSTSCSVDDFCADTPNATSALQNCSNRSSCGVVEMKENYMNYTPDACQNIITNDQKTRIRAVLENSPRRNTLGASLGCTPPPAYGFDAGLSIESTGDLCQTNVTPIVKIQNFGTDTTITSAEIFYGTPQGTMTTFDWIGTLAPGQSQNVTLSAIDFPAGMSTFTARLELVNGTVDDNEFNNVASVDINKAGSYTSTTVTMNLKPDNYGNETTWEVRNVATNAIVYQGGPYTNGDTTQITENFSLVDGQCYSFTIFDEYADGICCQYGNGFYNLMIDNQAIVEGGSFGESETTYFRLGSASISSNELVGISIYPNPSKGELNILSNDSELPQSYVIYNVVGQLIKSQTVQNSADLRIDTSLFSNGVYLIKINKEGKSKTLRFVKQ